ncbi:MAG: hypothetical protein WCB31_06200 [Nitrososphaeraceae archaeon]
MYPNCQEYIYSILPQVPLELIHTAIPLVKDRGIRFKHILPVDSLIPKQSEEFFEKEGYKDLIQKGKVERRMVNSAYIGLVVTENQAMIMFPNLKGQADMNFSFCNNKSSDEGLFHDRCIDYFFHIWNNSRTFDEVKLKKV